MVGVLGFLEWRVLCKSGHWRITEKVVSIRVETEFPYMENLECPYTDG